MAEQDTAPAAPESQANPPAADAASSPAGTDGTSAPAAAFDPEKAFRDLKAEMGRERAARQRAEQTAAELAGNMTAMQAQYNTVAQHFAAQQRAQQEAQLATLPPEQRIEKRVELAVQRQIQQMGQNGVQQARNAAPQRETPEQYQARRSREIADEVNREFGLTGDSALAADDPDLVTDSEAEYRASARVLARARSQSGGTTVAGKGKQSDEAALEARITAKVMQDLGAGKSNAAKPAGGSGAVTEADYGKVLNQGNKLGFKARQERLRELRDRAEANVDPKVFQ